MRRSLVLLVTLMAACTMAVAQPRMVKMHRQHSFDESVPAGNYSGITRVADNDYAVVSDKADDGFMLFTIDIDRKTGNIKNVRLKQTLTNQSAGRDAEDITFFAPAQTLFLSGESDNQALEYDMSGKRTGRKLKMPKAFTGAGNRYGVEALTYNAKTHTFWATTESTLKGDGRQAAADNHVKNKLRLQAFDEHLAPAGQYFYVMDAPVAKKKTNRYAMGCSALTALDDGRLLVLEREFYVPGSKLGAFVNNKIYVVFPQKKDRVPTGTPWDEKKVIEKTLLCEWRTHLTLFEQSIANYEGMCLGPQLDNGDQVILLVSDSQNQYGGVLSDWFKTIVIRCE